MNNEIIEVPTWETIFWDMDDEREVTGMPTGAWGQRPHRVVTRYVERPWKKMIHVTDGGELVRKWHIKGSGFSYETNTWDECSKCNKHFNETGYE